MSTEEYANSSAMIWDNYKRATSWLDLCVFQTRRLALEGDRGVWLSLDWMRVCVRDGAAPGQRRSQDQFPERLSAVRICLNPFIHTYVLEYCTTKRRMLRYVPAYTVHNLYSSTRTEWSRYSYEVRTRSTIQSERPAGIRSQWGGKNAGRMGRANYLASKVMRTLLQFVPSIELLHNNFLM